MKNYLFYDDVTGEEFLVEEKNLESATKIAEEYFDKPHYTNVIMTRGEAEMSGLDTY